MSACQFRDPALATAICSRSVKLVNPFNPDGRARGYIFCSSSSETFRTPSSSTCPPQRLPFGVEQYFASHSSSPNPPSQILPESKTSDAMRACSADFRNMTCESPFRPQAGNAFRQHPETFDTDFPAWSSDFSSPHRNQTFESNVRPREPIIIQSIQSSSAQIRPPT